MSWGAVAGAAVGLIGSQMNKKKDGGAGTSTNTKEPWAAAAPWLQNLLGQGQSLYDRYAASPFSEQQQAAYGNQYALSDAVRGLVPSLLTQMQGQPVGFDPHNPTAKAKAFDWTSIFGGGAADGTGGGTGTGGGLLGQRSISGLGSTPAVLPAAEPKGWAWDGQFHDQGDILSGLNFKDHSAGKQLQGEGGFGSFRYGQEMPQAGTDAYRDYSEYFLRGGSDPNNMYGRGVDPRSREYVPAGGA